MSNSTTKCCQLLLVIFLLAPTLCQGGTLATPTGLCINNQNCSKHLSNITAPASTNINHFNPGYYMLIGPRESAASHASTLQNSPFKGLKKFYIWNEIETAYGVYDFSNIRRDLEALASQGKYLWIQVNGAVMSSPSKPWVPRYMWNDSKYGCGPDGDGDAYYYGTYKRKVQAGGWMVCFWNENVAAREKALFEALGREFNSEKHFEGILAGGETAINMGAAVVHASFSKEKALQALKEKVLAAKHAFPNKSVMQDINYGPFDFSELSVWLAENGIGLTGPDVHLMKEHLINNVWPYHYANHYKTPTAIDVQWDNYERYNPEVGRANTASELRDGAIKHINPWYMFWKVRSPYFNDDVIPAVQERALPAAKAFYDSMTR